MHFSSFLSILNKTVCQLTSELLPYLRTSFSLGSFFYVPFKNHNQALECACSSEQFSFFLKLSEGSYYTIFQLCPSIKNEIREFSRRIISLSKSAQYQYDNEGWEGKGVEGSFTNFSRSIISQVLKAVEIFLKY